MVRRSRAAALVALVVAAACTDPIADSLHSASAVLDTDSTDVGATEPASRWRSTGRPMVGTGPTLERVPCPETELTAEATLNAANRLFEAAELPASYACAEIAADLAPQAVEAHHLRGAALATMGHVAEAQLAFAMALALDPDDPETLAAVADFYINVFRPRSRDQLLLGLEYARRGSERAATRRRSDRQLRARLSLLEAEAMNDLGSPDLAAVRVKDALTLSPNWIEAEHELGVSLLNLCKLDLAAEAFTRVLAVAADDPYAHFHLGLIEEYRGKSESAAAHFARARALAPAEFFAPMTLEAKAFRAEVDEAIASLGDDEKSLLAAVKLEIVALPALEDLTAVDPPFSPTILGLYRGLPVGVDTAPLPEVKQVLEPGSRSLDTVRHVDGEVLPRAVVLYRNNLLRVSRNHDELDAQILRTLRHELGHAKGLDEDDLRRLGLE